MEDQDCRDQFSVIYEAGDRTSIFWCDVKEPVPVEERAVSDYLIIPKLIFAYSYLDLHFLFFFIEKKLFSCSAGLKHTFVGLQEEPIWLRSIRGVLPCGEGRSSSKSRGSAIKGYNSLTFLHVRGRFHMVACLSILRLQIELCNRAN